MKHTESTVDVFYSNEYSLFKMINGNRQLNELKIKRIIHEIEAGNDMLKYYPIQVRENKDRLDILDGQHRFWICKKLKRPVYYILVKEDKSMPDIAKVNSNVDKWKNTDYINCYVQQNNKHYQTLQEFIDTYGFNVGLSINLLSLGNPFGDSGLNTTGKTHFEHGLFEVKFKKEAIEIAEISKLFSDFAFWRSRPFVFALFKIKRAAKISIDEVLAAYKKRPEMLTAQADYKNYIYNLEQLVNVGKQHRRVIV